MRITIDVQGVEAINAELEKTVRDFQNTLASTLKSELVPRTPIDSGRARRGWQQRQSGSQAVVENRVPYIERLEKGYSKQAPKGFVNQAISATVKKTKGIIK